MRPKRELRLLRLAGLDTNWSTWDEASSRLATRIIERVHRINRLRRLRPFFHNVRRDEVIR